MHGLGHETRTLKQDPATRIYSLCQYSFAYPLRKYPWNKDNIKIKLQYRVEENEPNLKIKNTKQTC